MARSWRNGSRRPPVAGGRGLRTPTSAMVVVWLALIAAPLGAPVAEEVTVERANAAARAVLADGRFQRALPVASPDADDGQDDERAASSDDRRSMPRRTSRPPMALGEVARILLWGLVAVVAILSIMFLITEAPHLRRRLRRGGDAPADEEAMGEAGAGRSTGGSLDEADRVARNGAHGEAIHIMLLSLVETLNRKIGRRLAHSLTGREIVGVAGLAERPGAALSRVVRAAERSHFGGRRSSRGDYDACRRDYLAVVEETGTAE